MTSQDPVFLAADVGGTNTRIALCRATRVEPSSVRRFQNDSFPSLEAVLEEYRSDIGETCDATCVAVAGPVKNGEGHLTNRDWSINAAALSQTTGASKSFVINDLEAQGHALDHVAALPILGAGGGGGLTRLVVGVGTGFNAAPVHTADGVNHVSASEAGHISLPVWNADSLALAESIARDHGFASIEEALSGRGLLRVYSHCLGAAPGISGQEVLARADKEPDGPEARAARLMSEILGRVVGDLALIHLPDGGIFLVGGMTRALQPWIASESFATGFHDKGRFSDFMTDFPVSLIEDDFAALVGCAGYILRNL